MSVRTSRQPVTDIRTRIGCQVHGCARRQCAYVVTSPTGNRRLEVCRKCAEELLFHGWKLQARI